MNKVLFITYLLPPQGGVGVQRAVKFIKYLPRFGWEPVVLTTKNDVGPNLDKSLLEDIPQGLKVYRSFCFEPQNYKDDFLIKNFSFVGLRDKLIRNFFRFFDFIFIPDEQVLWIITAVLTGVRVILKEKIDVIFATGDPFTTFLIGYFLKKITGRQLILDFRDEWTQGYFIRFQRKYPWQRKLEAKLEKKMIKEARKVISVTEGIIQNFKDNYPEVKEKFVLIPNGYDEDDFDRSIKFSRNNFVILHSGKLYKLRSPRILFNSIKVLCKNNLEFKDKVKIVFIGEVSSDLKDAFEQFEYKEKIVFYGFKPHKEAVNELLKSSVLCLILDDAPEARRVYTAKIFEYMASNRPMLIFAPKDSEVARLVGFSKLSFIAQDEFEGSRVLLGLFEDWKKGKECSMNNLDFIHKDYSRESLTGKLAEVLKCGCYD